jgi:hypothetical protein
LDGDQFVYPLQQTLSANSANGGGDGRRHSLRNGIKIHTDGSWLWSGTSFTLEDAFRLNGFNEKLDGAKGLEDCEFGLRLAMCGKKFVLDEECALHYVDHRHYACDPTADIPFRENLSLNTGVTLVVRSQRIIAANAVSFDKKQMETIRREVMRTNQYDCLDEQYKEKLELWQNTPTFDLKQEWHDLHSK